MSWLTFVLLALVLIFAVQGFRRDAPHGNINGILLMVLGVTSWLNPYISDFVRERPPGRSVSKKNVMKYCWSSWKAEMICRASQDRYLI